MTLSSSFCLDLYRTCSRSKTKKHKTNQMNPKFRVRSGSGQAAGQRGEGIFGLSKKTLRELSGVFVRDGV